MNLSNFGFAEGRMQTPLARAIQACRGAFVSVGIFSLTMSVLLLTLPLYMMQVYDRVLGSGSMPTLIMLTLLAVAALGLSSFLESLRQMMLSRIGAQIEVELGGPLLIASITNAARGDGNDVQSLRDLGTLRGFFSGSAVTSFFDLPLAPLFVLVVFIIHPWLGVVNVVAAVLLFALTFVNQRWTALPLENASKHGTLAVSQAQSYVRNADIVQAMGMQPETIASWGRDNVNALEQQLEAARRGAIIAGLTKFVRLTLQVAILGVGAWLVLDHQITAGMIFAANIIGSRAVQPVEGVIGAWKQIVGAQEAYLRTKAILEKAGSFESRMALPDPVGDLAAEGLIYAPKGSQRPILRQVSFALAAGKSLGIVGPSGAGKSTLARIIVGAVEPSSGKVRIDGADLSQWNRDELGKFIGYMPQQPEFFPGTVGQNIARMSEGAPAEGIIAAAVAAGVHEMILKMPQGYDTRIGLIGMELSGGQKQRVGLARAFYGSPRLLVLDEPNANLDPEGEDALLRALQNARMRSATVVIVAQRPSAIQNVDFIMVLREGQVDAIGPREEVLAKITPKHPTNQPTLTAVSSLVQNRTSLT